MFHLSVLLSKFRSPFKLLEKKLLIELQNNLSSEAQSLFIKQIEGINLVQRHSSNREVCCYTIKSGKPYRNPNLQFRAREQELKFASIKFSAPNFEKPWKADFFLVNGFFFSMVFTPSAKPIQDVDEVVIENVKILCDPATEISVEEVISSMPGTVDFRGWLVEWSQTYGLRDVHLPLKEEERQRLLKRIDAKLPKDYLEIVDQCEGFVIQDCQIFGLSDIYDTVGSEHNYYLLAELIDKGMVGVREKTEDGGLYFLDYGGGDVVELGDSFRQAIEDILK